MNKEELLKNNIDELTGLLEKQAFYVWAQELIDTASDDSSFAFIFFDMDNFKLFNANYGFEKGDELLVEIAKIIKNVFNNQLIARFSGDHFVVCANTTHLIPAITEIRKQVKQIQKNINLELKVGVYILDGETKDAIYCSEKARMACVSIKKKYDIDYKFYDEELAENLKRKQFILDGLDEALEKGYIQVYYQPILRAITGVVCGWEALVRWVDPDRGVVYPNEFISVLEEYRLIHKLDSYVIEQVVKNVAQVCIEKPREAVPVSINLSRIDFEALDMLSYIDEIVKKYGADYKMFQFEITESVLMENPKFIQEQIVKMRNKGYEVWMDDFGSGYSSLNILKNFDFDLVKIDMEFLRGFESSDDGKIIIKHMVSMLKNLGFHTLAEGVETKEQQEFLRDLGCEMIQGYLIGRPMPYMDAVERLEKDGYKYEDVLDRFFYDNIGRIDILKQNPLESMETQLLGNTLPLALGVVKDGVWRFIYANEGYRNEIKVRGHESLQIAEDMINGENYPWIQKDSFWEICDMSKKSRLPESIEFVENGKIIVMRVRHIFYDIPTKSDAYLASIRSIFHFANESFQQKLSIVSKYLLSFYECIDIFGVEDNYYENLYLANSKIHISRKDGSRTVIRNIAEMGIHEDDRLAFLDYMNLDTIKERLAKEPNGVTIKFFRILNYKDEYIWKGVTLRLIDYLGKQVLLSCVNECTVEYTNKMNYYVEELKKDSSEVLP